MFTNMLRTCRHVSTYGQLSRCLKQVRQCSAAASSKLRPHDVSGTFTDFEVSKEDFKWVERILPSPLVPEPPHHDSYPTPSGWVPQKARSQDLPYFVRRTRFHNMPIYMEQWNTRRLTCIRFVEGDIWKFESELKQYLEQRLEKKMYLQVDELCNKVRVRGFFLEEVKDFLLEKGL